MPHVVGHVADRLIQWVDNTDEDYSTLRSFLSSRNETWEEYQIKKVYEDLKYIREEVYEGRLTREKTIWEVRHINVPSRPPSKVRDFLEGLGIFLIVAVFGYGIWKVGSWIFNWIF